MKILSIETSCDDTCISILEAKTSKTGVAFKVLANSAISQINTHRPYGGVYPVLAKREHAQNLPIVLEECLKQLNTARQDLTVVSKWTSDVHGGHKPINLIAVTTGPGLEMCLWEGIVFAKELGNKWGVPIIPVNHMEGHVLSVFGKEEGSFKIPKINFPALALLISGGHTELVLMQDLLKYKIIGQTVDDAVGESFDKVARMLDLPYPGGPEISRLAEEARRKDSHEGSLGRRDGAGQRKFSAENFRAESGRIFASGLTLPRPMLHSKNFDFSYSGLKTAVLYLIRDLGGIEKIEEDMKKKIALEFENAAIECLTHKTEKAIEKFGVETLLVGGGVAANKHLREQTTELTKNKKIKLLFPTQKLSTDNSIMIGIAGYLNFKKNKSKVPNPNRIKANGNLAL
jgi:N6-L-threonylcarbamoyladenine synthase